MKITDFDTDYSNKWLIYTDMGHLKVVPKDPLWLRWCKTLFQVLSCGCYDVYAHVRIDRVAKGLFMHFQEDYQNNQSCKKEYIKVINRLLENRSNLIHTHRTALTTLRTDVSLYGS